MNKKLRKLIPYIKLMSRYPLNVLAVYVVAMLSSFLLSLGPGLIKVFISEAAAGALKSHLIMIAILLVCSLCLSFAFDLVQGHISKILKLQIETDLRRIYFKYCQFHHPRLKGVAHGRGIFVLTSFCHHLVLDVPIGISTILLIAMFMMLEHVLIGVGVILLSFMFIIAIIFSVQQIGRMSRFKEIIKEQFFKKQEQEEKLNGKDKDIWFLHFIERLSWSETRRQWSDDLISFYTFLLFRILPALLLLTMAVTSSIDFAKATSLLLSFNLLHRPFTQLVNLYKQATLFYAQSELIRPDLEAAMQMDELSGMLPKGLVVIDTDRPRGLALLNQHQELPASRIFYLPNQENLLSHWGPILNRAAHSAEHPIGVFTEKPAALSEMAHFYLTEKGRLGVMHHQRES